ncbi:unnamed protein product [Ectocarpus sp. 12 AP-2014]
MDTCFLQIVAGDSPLVYTSVFSCEREHKGTYSSQTLCAFMRKRNRGNTAVGQVHPYRFHPHLLALEAGPDGDGVDGRLVEVARLMCPCRRNAETSVSSARNTTLSRKGPRSAGLGVEPGKNNGSWTRPFDAPAVATFSWPSDPASFFLGKECRHTSEKAFGRER